MRCLIFGNGLVKLAKTAQIVAQIQMRREELRNKPQGLAILADRFLPVSLSAKDCRKALMRADHRWAEGNRLLKIGECLVEATLCIECGGHRIEGEHVVRIEFQRLESKQSRRPAGSRIATPSQEDTKRWNCEAAVTQPRRYAIESEFLPASVSTRARTILAK